jgi:hypothetical protein
LLSGNKKKENSGGKIMSNKWSTTSSNKTPNYALSQWSLSDRPQMDDFNHDNEQIDKALSAVDASQKAAATQVSGLVAGMALKNEQIDKAIAAVDASQKATATQVSGLAAGMAQKVDRIRVRVDYTDGVFRMTTGPALPARCNLTFIAPADWSETDTLALNGAPIKIVAVGTGGNKPSDGAFSVGDLVVLEKEEDTGFYKSGGAGNAGQTAEPSQMLSSLPQSALVKVPVNEPHQARFGKEIAFRLGQHSNWVQTEYTMPMITDKIIQIMPFDGSDASNSTTKYHQSSIAQWLGSDAPEGKWYSPLHETSVAPSYADWAGFAAIFPKRFTDAVIDEHYGDWFYNQDTGKWEPDDVVGKFFLPEYSNGFIEGPFWRISEGIHPTEECVKNAGFSDPENFNVGKPWKFWTRDTNWNDQNKLTVGDETPQWDWEGAYPYDTTIGIRPVCNLPSTTRVSKNPDADGAYRILI